MGVFLALDLFLFFLMFELTLVPLYFLIGKWGHGRRVYAATKFFLYTMFGSAFMLVSIVSLAVVGQGRRRRHGQLRPHQDHRQRQPGHRTPGAGSSSASPSPSR